MDEEDEFDLNTYPLAPGLVVFTGWTGMGNTVIVKHDVYGVQLFSVYGHFGREEHDNSILVNPGTIVDYSTIIGLTGNSKPEAIIDPHLHFEVRFSNNIDLSNPTNPLSGMRYWAFEGENWKDYFVDLGQIWGYDSDNFGNR
jgi:murein DD-endopeptidase MepM/ murein hydrolase activator NlpD